MTAEEFLDEKETAAPTAEAFLDQPPTISAEEFLDAEPQSYAKATGNSLAQAAVKGVGHGLQGLGHLLENMPFSAGVGAAPNATEQAENLRRANRTALEKLEAGQESPISQTGQELSDVAAETYPVDPERQHQLGPRAGEMVGSFLPLVASGPFAPVTIGLESLGSHLDTDFQKLKADNPKLSDDEAAKKTIDRGLASGLTQATIFAALPPVLRKAGEKYLVEKFGPGVAKFLAGRVAQAGEGAALGATSAAGENIVSDRPLGENVLPSAGAMAILQTITAWPKGAARPRNLEADALEGELGGTPGPTIIPPSRQLRKPAIITPPPEPVQTPRRAPQTLDEIDMFLRDEAPVLPPEMLVRPAPKETPLSLSRQAVQENLDAMASLRQMKELDAAVEQVRQEILQREAAAPTPAPERPEVLAGQLHLVSEGKTPAMLITPGAEMKAEVPDHLRRVNTPDGEFVFDPTQTSAEEIAQRVADNSYGQLLGFGSESKPANGEAVLQTSDAKGIPLKEEVVSRETLPAALEAAQKIVPENGKVELKSAEDVLKGRLQSDKVQSVNESNEAAPSSQKSSPPGGHLADEQKFSMVLDLLKARAESVNSQRTSEPYSAGDSLFAFGVDPLLGLARAQGVESEFQLATTGSSYLILKVPTEFNSAGEAISFETRKYRVANHDASVFREKQFGKNTGERIIGENRKQQEAAGKWLSEKIVQAAEDAWSNQPKTQPWNTDFDFLLENANADLNRKVFSAELPANSPQPKHPVNSSFESSRGESAAPKLVPVEVTSAKVKAARTRLGRRSTGAEKRLAVEEEARRELFERNAFAPRPNTEPMPVSQLYRGEQVKFEGHPMRLVDFTFDEANRPDGVILEGAYGRQTVSADQVLHIDKGSWLQGVENWANETIKRRGGLQSIDPEILSAYAIKGVAMAMRGARDFAKWSAQMVKEFGEKVKPHLETIWAETNQLMQGTHPDKGLSMRAAKLMADEQLSSKVRGAIDPRYEKRSNEADTSIAHRLIAEAGGATQAAMNWVNGRFRGEPESVQTILGIEIQKQLAGMERRLRGTNPHGADAVVSLQQRLAAADIQRATDVAQGLQAFRVHYANWSPSAWIKDFRDTVGKVASRRVERVSGAKVEDSPTGVAQGIADAIADELQVSNPKVAQTIREQFGRKAEPGKRHPDPKTAKKIDEFYKREVEKFRKKHKIPDFDEATERDILRRANDLQRLPEDSVQRREAAQNLQNHLRKLKGFNLGELALDFWYANILSGASTHVKNMLGNAVNLTGEAGIQMLRNPTAIPQIIEALGRSLPHGAREAASVLRTGIESHGRHGNKFDSPAGALENVTSPVMGKILLPWKLVGRALRAEDAVFFHAMQEMRASVLARQQARTEGFPIYSTRLTNRVREIMGWTADAKAKAEAQAKAEGLTGDIAARRVNELIEQQRPPLLMENARDYAFLGTFNNDPYGVLGAATRYWGGFAEQVPAAKLVVPFTRIVANVTNSSLNWTPVGLWRAARAQGFKLLVGRESETGQLFGKKVTDPGAIGDQYARATIGTLALGGLAMAASQYLFDEDPKFMVTATGPNNKDQRELLQAAGWIPYSVKIGERYYSYADKPLAIGLSIVGHYLDAMRYRKLGQQDALNRAAFAIGASADVILNSSWLQGLSSIFSQANRDSVKTPLKGIPSQAIKTLSSFVVPNALRQVDQFFDPTKYTADEVREMVMRETPFVRRENKPDLNVFGEPVHAPLSKIFYSKVEGDVLIKTLAGRRIWPSVIVAGDLNSDEVYAVTQVRGAKLRMRLMQNYADIATRPRAEAQEIVSRISSEVTSETIDELGFRPTLSTRRQARNLADK